MPRWSPLALVLTGCPKPPADTAVTPLAPVMAPEAPAPVTTANADLVRVLSARDAPPPCSTIDALTPTPVEDLVRVVDTVQMPPYAPMRAAGCLLELHAEEAAPRIDAWMADPASGGLAELTAKAMDALPNDLAVRFAMAGLNGPHHAAITPALEVSAHPDVRALVDEPP
jgi:hypothetical protein